MTIAINARFLLNNYTEGIGNYTQVLCQHLPAAMPQHQFILIADRADYKKIDLSSNACFEVVSPAARHPLLWHYWFNVKISALLKQKKVDLFISPDNFCSLTSSVPQLLLLHDLAYLHQPQSIPKAHLWYYKTFTKKFARKAQHIITVSNYCRQDIMDNLHIAAEKINVVYNGIKSIFTPIEWEQKVATKAKYSNGESYFVCVSSIHPRKNIINLLKAFSIFKKWQKSDMKLVLVGRMAWKNNGFIKLLAHYKYKNDIVVTGYLPDTEVANITAAAYCAVYPSLFEGFGVPIVEAMQCDVPVICSNQTGMVEAGGDAAYFCNVEDVNDLAAQMQLVYKDENTRSKHIVLGREHVKQYNWNHSIQQIVALINTKFSYSK
jgi:glycosyltransferase involved in cell wall biosynthesis